MSKFIAICTALSVASCGGGISGSQSSYGPTTPVVGAERIMNVTFVDNANNIIAMPSGLRHLITTVNSDGSFVFHQNDPTNNSTSVIVNGTNYAVQPADVNVSSGDKTTSTTYTTGNVTCTYSPNAGGPTYPVQIGNEWAVTWVAACGTSPSVYYSQTGKVVGIESVTVPAGTFNSLHLTMTTLYTNTFGTTISKKSDTYKRISDLMTVKIETAYSYSGTPPAYGYPISEVLELQSYQ